MTGTRLLAAALLFSIAPGLLAGESLALNGGAEEAIHGRPVHWNLYGGAARAKIGQADEGHRGKCAYIRLLAFEPMRGGERNGEEYLNVGLVQGDSNAYSGPDAYVNAQPAQARFFKRGMATRYTVDWWMRGDAGPVNVTMRTWSSEEASVKTRSGARLLGKTMPSEEWTHYQATATLGQSVKRFCVLFQIYGFKADGVQLGTLYVDDVTIMPGEPLGPDALKRVAIPARPRIYVRNTPVEELVEAYRAGDDSAKTGVDSVLATAQKCGHLTDEALRDLFAEFEPRGCYSVCCPIHPFLVRYYNDFQWSLDDPWHLVCPYCKQEGRTHFKYPNPRYPDDGQGCAPTDEVWRQDHDEEWTHSHRGIPWERWDGICHGYAESRRFYFKGRCYCNIIRRVGDRVLARLAEAYQICDKVLPLGDPRRALAPKFAHQAQTIMLLMSRAHLGDDYLAAASGTTPDEFQRLVCGFLRADEDQWRYRPYPGFRPLLYPKDATVGDPVWGDVFEAKNRTASVTYYFGSWNLRAGLVGSWLYAACLLRESYTPEQQKLGLPQIAERIIVSREGDRERLAASRHADPYLKRGLVEYEIHPYNLESGGDNLLTSSLTPRLRMGLLLDDDEIVEKIAQDVTHFWWNMASGDGMGKEGSPTYAGGTWAPSSIAEQLHGMKGDFDTSAPYYDAVLAGLNLLGMPRYRRCLGLMHCLLPDGLYISFEDSCHGGSYPLYNAARVERYGGGIPEPYRGCLDIARSGDAVHVSLKEDFTLPSHLLHDNRKAVLRLGKGRQQMVAALDYSMIVGHYHEAPLSLMVYAKGHELASDLGYMGAGHHLTREWIRTFAAHNALIIRRGDGGPHLTRPLRGDLELFDAGGPVQVVEVAERDEADLSAKVQVYQRTVALVSCGDDDGYVVDVCRAKGGTLHDYQFHSHGQRFQLDGVKVAAVADQSQTLYAHSGFTFPCKGKYGSKNVDRLRTGRSTGVFTATWSSVNRYRRGRKGPTECDREVALRLWMLDEPGSQVIVGRAPGQRFLRNEDFGRTITQLRVRRPNRDAVGEFVAVVEPYRGVPFIRSVERLPSRDGVVAIKVTTARGIDYVVSATDEKPAESRDGDRVVRTAGRFCSASFDQEGRTRWMHLVRGTDLRVRDVGLKAAAPPCLTGVVTQKLPDDFALLVRSSPALPTGDQLAGRTFIIQHTRGRSSFTIASVAAPLNGVQRVLFAGLPKLLENVLRVKEVEPTRIMVEPPPVLTRSQVEYHVYHLGQGRLGHLGELRGLGSVGILDERGRRLHSFRTLDMTNTAGVRTGDEVAVSRIVPGRDTFEIPMRAIVGRDTR